MLQAPSSLALQIKQHHNMTKELVNIIGPRIAVFSNLLSADECDQLIDLARPGLIESNVVDPETGCDVPHPERTSSGRCFELGEAKLLADIETRIAKLTQWPVEHGEGCQILHYKEGAEYKPHFDYFDPAIPGNTSHLEFGGQRVATLIIYLNTVEAGGETIFPRLGLKVSPIQGHALYFYNVTRANELNPLSLHGGLPVLAGEKWICTKWLRAKPYTK